MLETMRRSKGTKTLQMRKKTLRRKTLWTKRRTTRFPSTATKSLRKRKGVGSQTRLQKPLGKTKTWREPNRRRKSTQRISVPKVTIKKKRSLWTSSQKASRRKIMKI